MPPASSARGRRPKTWCGVRLRLDQAAREQFLRSRLATSIGSCATWRSTDSGGRRSRPASSAATPKGGHRNPHAQPSAEMVALPQGRSASAARGAGRAAGAYPRPLSRCIAWVAASCARSQPSCILDADGAAPGHGRPAALQAPVGLALTRPANFFRMPPRYFVCSVGPLRREIRCAAKTAVDSDKGEGMEKGPEMAQAKASREASGWLILLQEDPTTRP